MVMPLGLVVELGPSMQGGCGGGLCVLLKAWPFSPSISKDHETKRHHLCEEHKLMMRHVFCLILCMWKKRFHEDVGDFCCTIKDVLLRCVRNCLFDRGKMINFSRIILLELCTCEVSLENISLSRKANWQVGISCFLFSNKYDQRGKV
jgi:hypothetical protein